MVAVPGEGPGKDGLSESAFGVFSLLKDNLADAGIIIARDVEEQLVIEALTWHNGHLATIVIQQDQLDPFKMVCWLGGALVKLLPNATREPVIDSVISTLEQLLHMETGDATIFVADADKELLKRLMIAELDGNCDFGIGFNGLYVAFHFACATAKDLAARGLIKPLPNGGAQSKPRKEKPYPE